MGPVHMHLPPRCDQRCSSWCAATPPQHVFTHTAHITVGGWQANKAHRMQALVSWSFCWRSPCSNHVRKELVEACSLYTQSPVDEDRHWL